MLFASFVFKAGKCVNAFLSFFFLTFWITPKVFLFSFREERKVRKHFYQHVAFAKVDRLFKKLYLFQNPYAICKRFLKSQNAPCIDAYGETPLTVFHQMFLEADLTPQDCFVDLGCGRGRGVLFASSVWSVFSIGVDQIPFFCKQAQKLTCHEPKAQFVCQKISSFPMESGTFFYFYGLCLEEDDLIRSCQALQKMRSKAKLVTVSFPITEYSSDFTLIHSWEAVFPWGRTEMFLQQRKELPFS
jgi:hypothetical protein